MRWRHFCGLGSSMKVSLTSDLHSLARYGAVKLFCIFHPSVPLGLWCHEPPDPLATCHKCQQDIYLNFLVLVSREASFSEEVSN